MCWNLYWPQKEADHERVSDYEHALVQIDRDVERMRKECPLERTIDTTNYIRWQVIEKIDVKREENEICEASNSQFVFQF